MAHHAITRLGYVRRFPARATIHAKNSEAMDIATISSGVAASASFMRDGRMQILSLHFSGDILGRADRSSSPHEVIALTDLKIFSLRKKTFLEEMKRDTALRERYLEGMLDQLDAARAWMTKLGRRSATARVASVLVLLIDRLGYCRSHAGGEPSLELPISREEVAGFTGLALETVSRSMTHLNRLGVISSDRRYIAFRNETQLRAIADDDPFAPKA